MRTLVESILDIDLDAHDEAVFTEQIIPEIKDSIRFSMRALSKDMTIKIENGNRILWIGGKRSILEISQEVIQVLKNHDIYEVRSEGALVITANLTGFNISACAIRINAFLDCIYTKCNITCDTLSIGGIDSASCKCNQCRIKTQTYKIHRTPIEFINSKIIGLNSVWVFLDVESTHKELDDLGANYSMNSKVSLSDSFEENISRFDPLEKLAGIKSITKLPNIYLCNNKGPILRGGVRLIFKSPRTPIDKQIAKVVTSRKEPIDCANNYQVIFMDR